MKDSKFVSVTILILLALGPLSSRAEKVPVKQKNAEAPVTKPSSNREKLKVDFNFEKEHTSDRFERTSINLQVQVPRRDLLWTYEGEKERNLFDWGFVFQNHTLSVLDRNWNGYVGLPFVGQKLSPQLAWKGALGVHQLESSDRAIKAAALISQAQLQWMPQEGLYVIPYLERNYAYQEMLLPGGLENKITVLTTRVQTGYQFLPRWKTEFKYQSKWLSDGNQKLEFDIALKYGISPLTPWVWLALGYNQINNKVTQGTYWSPRKFKSYGPRLDANFPLFYEVSIFGEYQHTWFQEEERSWSRGFAINGGLSYGDRNGLELRAYYSEIESKQGDRKWRSQLLNFGLVKSY